MNDMATDAKTTTNAKARGRKKKAKAVQTRPAKRMGFPTDAESILLRREEAAKSTARVVRCDGEGGDGFHGAYEVASAQWKDHFYRVEIRSLTEPVNTCDCQDHRMNRLGTCKHVERALLFIALKRGRLFREAAQRGPDTYEAFFDTRLTPPALRLRRPATPNPRIELAISTLFDDEGLPTSVGSVTWAALESASSLLDDALRARLRLSHHAAYWLERERRGDLLRAWRRRFESEVASGRRSDNPVLLPLYPYQKQGMLHLAFKGRALLADEMGLGKTVQAIAAAELLRQLGLVRRVLVVSPASLKAEWEDQLAHFTGIHAVPVFGARAARLQRYAQEHPYTLANYEQIRGDVDDVNRLLVPDLIILDEAQRIKNWPTRTAKTIKRLQSPFAFVLTGTPLENRIEELYSLVEFVDPHVFGSLFRFQRDYLEMTPENDVRPKNFEQLHRTVSTVMLRRRKSDVEEALPERTDKTFFVAMTDEQRRRYAEYEYEAAKIVAILKRRPLRKEEFERLQMMLGCMRMVCDTPFILDPECRDCPKLEELEHVLDDLLAEDATKVIVFSEWVRMLELVKELLVDKGIGYAEHTGKIPQQQRRTQINRFKEDPACRVFLSSESGGTGLNLQVANVVINLDLPWNPAKLEQRIARAWRKHQRRPVRVVNLVAENSIEHGMLGKLAYKSALADSVLDGAAAPEAPTSAGGRQAYAERVRELLGGEPSPLREVPAAAEELAKPRETGPKAVLASAQAADVQGIEELAETGACLVVARAGADLAALRAAAESAVPGKSLVLTPEMRTMLLRMQELGMLTLSPKLAALHAPEGYEPLAATRPPAPALHADKARKVWLRAASELKAAQALGGLGLAEQAAPHLATVLRTGCEALAALYAVADGDELPEHATPLHRQLRRDVGAANATDVAGALALCEDLAAALAQRE